MRIMIIICLVLMRAWAWGHQPDQAFFIFHEEEDRMEVEIEVPWTFRYAIEDFCGHLPDEKELNGVIQDYLSHHLILWGEDRPLDILNLKIMADQYHSHMLKLNLTYEKGRVIRIQNTVMLELYSSQNNYNQIHMDGFKGSVWTHLKSNDIDLKASSGQRRSEWGFIW